MPIHPKLRQNLNIPNALTLLRLLLIPVYVVLFLRGQKYAALCVFVVASLTDLLDGYLARKLNQITNLGKLMDPLADKLMVITAMLSMTLGTAAIPAVLPWAAVCTVACKELLMVLGGMYMLKRGVVVYSFMVGKVAHCLFIAALVLSYFHDALATACVGWPTTPDLLLVWLAVAATLVALVVYLLDAVRKLRALEK